MADFRVDPNSDRGPGPDQRRQHKYPPLPSLESLGLPDPAKSGKRLSGDNLPKMGKFRFDLLAQWVAKNYLPCRVADVGGGKGLLTYLLRQQGFDAEVIDPVYQPLPQKHRPLADGRRRGLSKESVPHRSQKFEISVAANYDLLIGLHAHGSNLVIIEAARELNKSFILMPCCVIDEPQTPPQGVNWFSWLTIVAQSSGFDLGFFRLNFKGQNIGFYSKSSNFLRRGAEKS